MNKIEYDRIASKYPLAISIINTYEGQFCTGDESDENIRIANILWAYHQAGESSPLPLDKLLKAIEKAHNQGKKLYVDITPINNAFDALNVSLRYL